MIVLNRARDPVMTRCQHQMFGNKSMKCTVTKYSDSTDKESVIQLWTEVFGYGTAHNSPSLAIEKKREYKDDLFYVARSESDEVIGTVMCGYDGHRGWIYSLAVLPDVQKFGVGTTLVQFAEKKLGELGCMKINLQIVAGNEGVQDFYEKLGYLQEARISMGKRLDQNIPKME